MVWKEGWTLYVIHDPLCDGVNDPSEEESDYDIYYDLLPPPEGMRYALGILRRDFSAARTLRVARMLQKRLTKVGIRLFAVAPPCGDGRKPYSEVKGQYTIGIEVITMLNAS
jgi:hypothetical protein